MVEGEKVWLKSHFQQYRQRGGRRKGRERAREHISLREHSLGLKAEGCSLYTHQAGPELAQQLLFTNVVQMSDPDLWPFAESQRWGWSWKWWGHCSGSVVNVEASPWNVVTWWLREVRCNAFTVQAWRNPHKLPHCVHPDRNWADRKGYVVLNYIAGQLQLCL